MFALLLLTVLLTLPMAVGLVRSWRQRRLGRHYLAAFLGFSAAMIALASDVAGLSVSLVWFNPSHPRHYHPVAQAFIAVCSVVGLTSTSVAFFSGFLCKGIRRVALIAFGPVVLSIYVMSAFTNFGG